MARGCFEWDGDFVDFDLKPKDDISRIPDDQRVLSHRIYSTMGVLKLLEEQGFFQLAQERGVFSSRTKRNPPEDPSLTEYRKRIRQVSEVGLERDKAITTLAADALDQIRNELVLRKGKSIKLKYLLHLLRVGVVGVLIGTLITGSSDLASYVGWPVRTTGLDGYGWVLIGAMVGAWLSVAATRWEVAFEELPNFLDSKHEPYIRMLFVGLLALMVALFVKVGLLPITIEDLELSKFSEQPHVALLLGFVSGIGERALTVRLITRARNWIAPDQSGSDRHRFG